METSRMNVMFTAVVAGLVASAILADTAQGAKRVYEIAFEDVVVQRGGNPLVLVPLATPETPSNRRVDSAILQIHFDLSGHELPLVLTLCPAVRDAAGIVQPISEAAVHHYIDSPTVQKRVILDVTKLLRSADRLAGFAGFAIVDVRGQNGVEATKPLLPVTTNPAVTLSVWTGYR